MKLQELIQQTEIKPNFEPYLRQPKDSGMKEMDVSKLEIEKFVIEDREILKSVIFTGHAGLMVNYKDRNAVGLSLSEFDNGETWEIIDLKKAKSSKTYRVVKSLDWRRVLSDSLTQLSNSPESEVKQIIMPSPYIIPEVEKSKHERIIHNYQILINLLRMQYSRDLNKYIVDVRKDFAKKISLNFETLINREI